MARGVCLCAVFIGLGYLHAETNQFLTSEHIAYLRYEERRDLVDIEGVIVSDVDVRQTLRGNKTSFELKVERLRSNNDWQLKEGKVLVNLFRQENVHYGDRVLITGKLHKPFSSSTIGHFSYEDYLKRNGVYWLLSVRKNADIKVLAVNQGFVIQSAAINSRHNLKNILDSISFKY